MYKLPKNWGDGFQIIGTTGLIGIYNAKGRLKTFFKNVNLHHDISIKTSNRIFALSWKTKKIIVDDQPVVVVYDSVIEIDLKQRKIVNKWPLVDYFPILNDKHSVNYPKPNVLKILFMLIPSITSKKIPSTAMKLF